MGQLVGNLGSRFHMNNGVLLGLAENVHLGSESYDHNLAEAGDGEAVLDLYRYAKESGHTDRAHAADFDTKATALWGSDYSSMASDKKDIVFLNTRGFPFTPWPPP